MQESKNGIDVSVGKEIAAYTENILVNDVCCFNCGSSAAGSRCYYCKVWKKSIKDEKKDFCSFFYVEED